MLKKLKDDLHKYMDPESGKPQENKLTEKDKEISRKMNEASEKIFKELENDPLKDKPLSKEELKRAQRMNGEL